MRNSYDIAVVTAGCFRIQKYTLDIHCNSNDDGIAVFLILLQYICAQNAGLDEPSTDTVTISGA